MRFEGFKIIHFTRLVHCVLFFSLGAGGRRDSKWLLARKMRAELLF